MPHLTLSCFGTFQATLDSDRLTSFHSVKVQALLAYLALEADRPHPRERLATLLWPLDAEGSARNSLRQALYELRKLLGDRDDLSTSFLLVTRQTVQFNQHSDYTLDVADFLAALSHDRLTQAVALYRGELLAGLAADSELFEEWLRQARERLHNLAIDALYQLAQYSFEQGDYKSAQQHAQRQLTLEPWREEAHRQLMTALALTGERSAALAQYESCRRILAEELGVEPDAETTSLYEQIKAGKLRGQRQDSVPASGQPKAEPTTHQVQPVRHNLPAQPTPFVGRTTDLAQLAVRLHDPACRLLTIVGPGGMGKTRLAIQAAQPLVEGGGQGAEGVLASQEQPPFRDGVFFVALAGVAAPELLVSTIAAALEFTFYGSTDPKTQLLDYLSARSLLLVLDNCEHLLNGINLVADLLAAASHVKVLATSREPLNLHEEWLYPLGGMSFPGDEDGMSSGTIADLTAYTAIQLFVQCARRMQPAFDLDQEEEPVVRICWLVGGMPLGIEMASSWLKHFSCTQIAQEVEHSLDFLATSLRNVPARHRSIRAVFEHSWSLLSALERQVLQRLAVFRGGFRLEAAQQVAGASFPLLVSLAEKSLVQPTPSGRYQMHELLRQFAEEKLRADPAEQARVQTEHCRYYTAFLGQQEIRLKGPEHLAAMLAIEAEIENVRAAWELAVAHAKLGEMEQALESLAYFYETKCWYDQAVVLFRKAADALAKRSSADRCQILVARIRTKQAVAQRGFFGEGGKPAFADTQEILEQSLTILQRFGETLTTGDIIVALSGTPLDLQVGQQLKHTALAIYEQHGDRWRMARTLEYLGFGANILGQYEEAKQYYQRGIALCQEIGDRRVLGDIQAIFAEVHRALGEYEEANRLAHASLAARTEAGNKRGIAFSFYVLGAIAWRMGNLEEALRYSQQSRDTFTEIGLLGGIDYAHSNLGHIACTLGDYAEARHQFYKILQSNLERDYLDSMTVPWALVGMASVLGQEGQQVQAIELMELVLRHPNAWQEAKNLAATLLSELVTELPPEAVVAAQVQTRDLKTVVVELLKQSGAAM